jgi:hypothetical protein
MAFVNMFLRHYHEIIAIFIVYILYKTLIRIKFIEWVNKLVNPQTIKTIPNQTLLQPLSLLDKAKKVIIELYYCSILVLVAYFIYAQLPQVSGVSDFTTIGQFLFMPPLKYLIIFQVAVGLILGLFSLPHMTLEKIVTPFGHYGVNKRIEEVTVAVDQVLDQLTILYRIRLNMLQTVSGFGIFTSNNEINEIALGHLTTYIEGCYNAIDPEAIKAYAVHFYGGSLDFNNVLEIPSLKILEAFKQRSIVASDDGILPAEVAVPLHITENSYVVLYLCSKTVWINKEDGEAIQGLWRFIRAIEMETEMEKKGLQAQKG